MTHQDDYVRALRTDSAETDAYHRRAIARSEQQKALEAILLAKGRAFTRIADIACGGGALSYHLAGHYPAARFTLVDRDQEALRSANELCGEAAFTYVTDDLHELSSLPDGTFDLVCCWQTLSWIKDPARAMKQLLRIAAPGATIMTSSLFNLDHDVDIRAQIRDRTRASGEQGHAYDYNTFSRATVHEWLAGHAVQHRLHPFSLGIDLPKSGTGIGTYTVNTGHGRLQISGGYLMNWAILEVTK
jgi:ubiquinone/menaquinone biosynthesis C-methylase UbiE